VLSRVCSFSGLREIYDVFEGLETVKPRCW